MHPKTPLNGTLPRLAAAAAGAGGRIDASAKNVTERRRVLKLPEVADKLRSPKLGPSVSPSEELGRNPVAETVRRVRPAGAVRDSRARAD